MNSFTSKIVIFTDEAGWHGAELKTAFASRQVEAIVVPLRDCNIQLSTEHSDGKPVINIPHFSQMPKAAFVRGIAGGTLQQITMRLNILHMLKALGVTIYNDGKAIERTVDKAMTSFLLQQHNVATPSTWVCESRHQAHEIMQKHEKLVIKPLFGSQGQGVRLVENTAVDKKKLPLPMDMFVDGVFYMQQYVEAAHDYRVFIVNNQVVAAMQRAGETWLHNVAQGARCKQIHDEDILEIALQAASALDIAYCGVDVIRDNTGKCWVLEVNSIPAWRGLQEVTQINIAQVLVDDFLKRIE